MKILKRVLLFLLILMVLLVAMAFLVPVLFKDKLLALAQEEINNTLNAEVIIGDVDVTIFKSFPDLTLELQGLEVKGTGLFQDITLASIEDFMITVDINSVIGGKSIAVKNIELVGPSVHAKVLEDGTANWDIVKESDDVEDESSDEESEGFNLELDGYSVSNGRVIFHDLSTGMHLDVLGLNHSGSGNFGDELYILKTLTTVDTMNLAYGGIPYLNRTSLDLKIDMEIDNANAKYTFKENEAKIDLLPLRFDGYVAMPTDDIEMDLTFEAAQTDLRYLLSMIPAEFMKDMEGVEVDGQFALNGMVKGTMTDSLMPAFDLDLSVDNGRVRYPDLPKSIDAINVRANVNSPEGADMDGMVIDVSRFETRIADGPINARLNLKRPISDPYIDLDLGAQLNLENLKDAMPLEENEALNGSITANVKMKGAVSAIEEERYEDFHASGDVIVLDMTYRSDSLPYDIGIQKAYMGFSPQFLELQEFAMTIGGSDLSAKGRIDNYLSWILKNETIVGSFTTNSQKFDLVELMGPEEAASETAQEIADTTSIEVLEVPANVDFNLSSSFNELIYDNLEMTDVKGQIVIKDQVARLSDLSMQLLGGTVKVNGAYSTPPNSNAHVDFSYDVRGMDIKRSAEYINTIYTLAPIAKSCTGKFNTKMVFKSDLDNEMAPIESTMTGSGDASTNNVTIEGFKPLVDIAKAIKVKEIESTSVNDVQLNFNFYDGKVYVQPFKVKVDRIEAEIGGSTSFAQDIDYIMECEVPTDMIGGDANQFLEGLVEQANALGTEFSVGEKIKMDVMVKGTVDRPKITVRPKGVGQNVMETIKEEINKEIDKQKEAALEEARKEADRLISEAEAQAQALRDEAKKLSDQARAEGYAQAQKLEDDAKDPFAKMGAKIAADALRKETDKRADQIISEADKNANKIVDEAKRRADKLLEDAAKI